MPKAKTTGTHIDSCFQPMAKVPGLASSPGIYDKHPNVGPGSPDSGIPLKFFDESIAHPGTMPSGPSMTVVPAKTHKS
jgi:hypothetical protein